MEAKARALLVLASCAATLAVATPFAAEAANGKTNTQKARAAASAFLHAEITGDGRTFCSYFSRWTLRANYLSFQQCVKTYMPQFAPPSPFVGFKVTRIVLRWNGEVADIHYRLTARNGKTYRNNWLTFVRENGNYKYYA